MGHFHSKPRKMQMSLADAANVSLDFERRKDMINLRMILKKIGWDKPICVYTDSSTKFSFGRVLVFDEDFLALISITPKGLYDGVLVIPIEDIMRIAADNQYCAKMKALTDEAEYNKFPYTINNVNVLRNILELSKKDNTVISIEVDHSGYDDVTGIVAGISDGMVEIDVIDEYGCEDGKEWVQLEDITRVSYFSETEQVIQKLFNSRADD